MPLLPTMRIARTRLADAALAANEDPLERALVEDVDERRVH